MYHPAPPKTYLQIHMYHPFTSKASLLSCRQKNYGGYICIFFSARTKYVCACARLCARSAAQIRTFSSVLSEFFLHVICVFRALAAACENLPLSYCHANATTAVALPVPTPRRQRQRFHANATTAAVATAPPR
jgi:hypothetical protein